MSRNLSFLMLAVLLFVSTDASARTTIHHLDVADVLNNPAYANRLQGVSFYFGNSPHPAPSNVFGEYRTNKKTNAFRKTDVEACQWVMLSALLALHSRAQALGANAVVNIRSNFKGTLFESDTQYSCGAGAVIAGVALIGDVVKID